MEHRELFGGAIEIHLPSNLVDVSNFRQIPNHQEVFADGNTDTSFIFEIFERPEHLPDQDAVMYYWNDLVSTNEATYESIQDIQVLECRTLRLTRDQSRCFATKLTGEQLIAKDKDSITIANLIQVDLCLIRLQVVNTDLVLSLNTPLQIHEQSSSSIVLSSQQPHLEKKSNASFLFKSIVETAFIADWSLFN
eukprot:g4469.t1